MRTAIIGMIVFLWSCVNVLGQSDYVAPGHFGLEIGGGYGSARDIDGATLGISLSIGGTVDIVLSKGWYSASNPDGDLNTTTVGLAVFENKPNQRLNHLRWGGFFQLDNGKFKGDRRYLNMSSSTISAGVLLLTNPGRTVKSVVQPRFLFGVMRPARGDVKFEFVWGVGLSMIFSSKETTALRINPAVTYYGSEMSFNISISIILGQHVEKSVAPTESSGSWN